MGPLVFLLLLLVLVCTGLFLALVTLQRRLDRERKKAADEAFDRRPVRACRIINESHGKHRWWSKVRRPELGWAWVEFNEYECPGVVYTLEHDVTMRLRTSLHQETRHVIFGDGRNPDGPVGLLATEADPSDAFCGSNAPHEAHWPTVEGQQFYCDGNMDDEEERNW